MASSCSQRQIVEADAWHTPRSITSRCSSVREQRPSGRPCVAGSSQAIALTSASSIRAAPGCSGMRLGQPGHWRWRRASYWGPACSCWPARRLAPRWPWSEPWSRVLLTFHPWLQGAVAIDVAIVVVALT